MHQRTASNLSDNEKRRLLLMQKLNRSKLQANYRICVIDLFDVNSEFDEEH